MKKFFKKIGKGLKKLGKGIMKVLNSKIGRIIGMVSLAFGVGAVFKAMYQGLTQGTAQAAAAGASQASGVVVEEGVSTAAQRAAATQATEKAVTQTAQVSADLGAKISQDVGQELVSNGNIAVNSVGEAASKIGTLAEKAGTTAAGDVASVTQSGFNSSVQNTIAETTSREIQYTAKDIVTQVPETATSAATTATTESASLLSPTGLETSLPEGAATYQQPNLLQPTELDLTKMDITGVQTSLPEGASTYTPDLLSAAEKAEVSSFTKLNPKKLADSLKDPTVRARYDELTPLTQGLKTEAGTSLQLTPSAQLSGVQEFTSFKEAFQGGDNLLSGAGNVAERFMTYDLGELTKGKLTGFIGSRGAYNTATVAARTFAGPEEVDAPAGRNIYSGAIAADLAAQGATTAYQPQTLAMDFSNQMATGNVTNPFTTLNNIRQKAGFGNLYGSLNSVAGIVG